MTEDAAFEQLQARLIAEQFSHTIDLLRKEIQSLQAEQQHSKQMADHRLLALESSIQDHETRLRSVTDGVTQFKVWSGLASGGSGIMAIVALIRSWLGG